MVGSEADPLGFMCNCVGVCLAEKGSYIFEGSNPSARSPRAEELRRCRRLRRHKARCGAAWRYYFRNQWNYVDVVNYLVFIVAGVLRYQVYKGARVARWKAFFRIV